MKVSTAALIAAMLAAAGGAQADDRAPLMAEGKALIQKFAGALKSELMAAMTKGGPVHAIGVCKTRAPEIAASISAANAGWTIARSSHKLRNPANAPDAYTMKAIEDFLARAEKGETTETMARAEILTEGGQRVFRMVKAIPTGALCLACHGAGEVSDEVSTALAQAYPKDLARGFRQGQMRGVFTLKKILD